MFAAALNSNNSQPKKRIRHHAEQKCRECGCTNDDCRACIKKTGSPCYWVEPDLCSACKTTKKKTRKKKNNAKIN